MAATAGSEAIYDAIVIGGGPAGSTCARVLTGAGARVAVIDRAEFPRVKLCAGWISAPIWSVLGLAPHDYPGGLWPWQTCRVRYRGVDRAVACRGWFIRRYELDDHLLRTSGADLRLGVGVKTIERDADGVWSVAGLRARHLIGAGGTHCPVARLLAPPRPRGPVGVQEHELAADPIAVARTRAGADGDPELLLHDDLAGYSWNVPKTAWLNVGTGTADPRDVRAAWIQARAHFQAAGHLPDAIDDELAAMRGHSYYLYDPAHLAGAARADADGKGGAYLVGDSLGLAHPLTAEGIVPAALSGRVLAEAIVAGDPAGYPDRLAAHPLLADYRRIHRLRETAIALRRRRPQQQPAPRGSGSRLGARAVATAFAWMFSGATLPAPRLIDLALAGAGRWLERRPRS
jgi:menaquinone-9 beta-reductase